MDDFFTRVRKLHPFPLCEIIASCKSVEEVMTALDGTREQVLMLVNDYRDWGVDFEPFEGE